MGLALPRLNLYSHVTLYVSTGVLTTVYKYSTCVIIITDTYIHTGIHKRCVIKLLRIHRYRDSMTENGMGYG